MKRYQPEILYAKSTLRIGRVGRIGLGRMPIFTETISIEEPIQRAPADTEQSGRSLLIPMG